MLCVTDCVTRQKEPLVEVELRRQNGAGDNNFAVISVRDHGTGCSGRVARENLSALLPYRRCARPPEWRRYRTGSGYSQSGAVAAARRLDQRQLMLPRRARGRDESFAYNRSKIPAQVSTQTPG